MPLSNILDAHSVV